MSQVFSNLLSNAVNYGDWAAPIKVNLNSTAEGVSIRVNSQGNPIPPPTLNHIFEPLTVITTMEMKPTPRNQT